MSRGKNPQSEGDREVTVDATLEADLGVAEVAIEAYLEDPSATRSAALLAALQLLDQHIELSDDYEGGIAGSAALGYSSKGSVIGETSSAGPNRYSSVSPRAFASPANSITSGRISVASCCVTAPAIE